MRSINKLLVTALAVLYWIPVASAQDLLPEDNGIYEYHKYPRYRESESHPLRTVAYILHPIGWALREGIYRPWSYFAGSTEFNRSFFGFREPFDFRNGLCDEGGDHVPDCRALQPWSTLGYGPGDVNPGSRAAADASAVEATAKQVFIPDVNFDFNKSTLNELGKGRVRQIAQLLASEPGLEVIVEGNTDFKGADDYNEKLGMARAETVKNELVELGIDAARLTPISRGESAPVFTEEEDWARAVNRRVRFEVKPEGDKKVG